MGNLLIISASINNPSTSRSRTFNAGRTRMYSRRLESLVLCCAGKLGGRRQVAKKRRVLRVEPQERSSKSSFHVSDSADLPLRASCCVL